MPTKKVNPALMKPMNLSADLADIIGNGPFPRGEVVKRIWDYIKKNDLQNPKNKRNIFADEKLAKIFAGKKEVTMFELTSLVSKQLS